MVSALAGFAHCKDLCITIEIHKIQDRKVCTEMWQCSKLQFSKHAYLCTVNWLLSQIYATTSMWNPSRSASFRSKGLTKVETGKPTFFDNSHRWNIVTCFQWTQSIGFSCSRSKSAKSPRQPRTAVSPSIRRKSPAKRPRGPAHHPLVFWSANWSLKFNER